MYTIKVTTKESTTTTNFTTKKNAYTYALILAEAGYGGVEILENVTEG